MVYDGWMLAVSLSPPHRVPALILALVGCAVQLGSVCVASEPVQGTQAEAVMAELPTGQIVAPPAALGIPSFYTQLISASGYPIVASERVNPFALHEAAYLVDLMLTHRPDVRAAMIRRGSRLCILGCREFTSDLPEFHDWPAPPEAAGVSGRDYWDARARGTGGSLFDPTCSCGEENLLGYPGDPYATESILIHEFAHTIHQCGLAVVDPSFDRRLRAAYRQALADGLWQGTYAAVDHAEYFAEGTQSWFDTNRANDSVHNHVNTRAGLIEYDPRLAALCREVFGDAAPTYTHPTTRLTGHLAGYDPATAPTFTWPPRLRQVHATLRAAASPARAAAGP